MVRRRAALAGEADALGERVLLTDRADPPLELRDDASPFPAEAKGSRLAEAVCERAPEEQQRLRLGLGLSLVINVRAGRPAGRAQERGQ